MADNNNAASTQVIFSMVGVSKIIPPNKTILNNIYLSFYYGAKIGIIGLNGSGKSTLLNMVSGFAKPTMGQVRLRSQPITKPGLDRMVVFKTMLCYLGGLPLKTFI